MNVFIDDFLVGAVLLAGFGYATYSLGPKSLRPRMLSGLSWLLDSLPRAVGFSGLARRLAAKAGMQAKASCGGCDSCGSEQPPADRGAAGEVRIPLAKIGKRR